MAKKVVRKKKNPIIHHRVVARKEKTSADVSQEEPNLAIDVKGATAGEKGTELHFNLTGKSRAANKQGEGSDLHLYVGKKGGDKEHV